jgi:hypothetical protein
MDRQSSLKRKDKNWSLEEQLDAESSNRNDNAR